MKHLRMLCLVLMVFTLSASRLHAIDLWPFNNDEPKSTSPKKKKTDSGWSMPSLWPSSSPKPKQGPSTLDRINHSSKKFWHDSTSWLRPDPKPAKRNAGYYRKQEEPSLLSRLFGAEPRNEGPQTVTEWMRQPRMDP